MAVNGTIAIDMKRKALPMQEINKLEAVRLLNDIFMY